LTLPSPILFLLLGVVGCRDLTLTHRKHFEPPNPAVRQLIELYAPRITVGDRADPTRSAGYQLALAPYSSWEDTSYRGPDSVHGVRFEVDEYLASEESQPSQRARVAAITLGIPTTSVLDSVLGRLRQRLGAPTLFCRGGPPGSRAQLYYWPDSKDHGTLLNEALDATQLELADAASALLRGHRSIHISD